MTPSPRLGPGDRVALMMHDHLDDDVGKLGVSMLRYGRAEVVAIIDRTRDGGRAGDALPGLLEGRGTDAVPIVPTVEAAVALGATILIVAITPLGGRLPEGWLEEIGRGADLGLSIVNPLHARWADHPELAPRLKPGRWIWDVRAEPEGLAPAAGRARHLEMPRILVVGTDMAVGKMTAGLELVRALASHGRRPAFVATGQVGICVHGDGVALDAVRVDYAAGAVEQAVLRAAADADVLVVEGQGALTHPAASANLPLLRGSLPTHLLLVHRAGQRHPMQNDWVHIPPRSALVRLYEDLAACAGAFGRPETLGIALNTARLDEAGARRAIAAEAAETGLPVTDPVRFGVEPLIVPFVGTAEFP
jgi:uncharacterized NAD-dependent epimerase/dehydratase family protein